MNANMKTGLCGLALIALQVSPGLAENSPPAIEGLMVTQSAHSVTETLDRLEDVLTQNDITVATRIDHGANADSAGMELGPTQVLLFANPALGTQLMQSERAIGVDLPLKAIAWEDENGEVWLGFIDPAYLAERYGIEDEADLAGNMSRAVRGFVEEAAAE